MYLKLLYFVGAICHIYSTTASKAPFITKCKAEDSECIKKNAIDAVPIFAAGIPDLGVETMDPLIMKHIDASTGKLKLTLTDAKLTGLKNCLILSIRRDKKNFKLFMSIECSGDITGKYEADGKLMFIPIKGRGDTHFVIRKAQLDFDCDLSENKGDDGKIHSVLKNAKYTIKLKDKASIDMTGLFDGNEVLSKAAKDLFKTNPNEIVMEMGTPVFKAFVNKVIENIENFFKAVPNEDLEIM